VCLKADKCVIKLSDGSTVRRLYIWHEPDLPAKVEHNVSCLRGGRLKFWNIYRVSHSDGTVTEEQWTGNAGMILVDESQRSRHYRCSDGVGPFDERDLELVIEWTPS